ncbi:DoxX protein [Aequorivita sublithincola DSM 14238]|uniref:DoxX protein n=1 Tax=Aequorivita sublithincola (strain DSM 14238 / LMG 21431 / ACAM 643 / 9-3) TaxID=746697 RepID=I3YUJ2_AEQSU|nr:DoxX family protein [Aequorivita sublithincola]AFL80660.1 DoxX protein [Aequorivita sublithincola DSM 14238]
MILDTAFLAGFALLLLRIIIAIVFFSSGKSHVQKPEERGKSIGMSPTATTVLGIAEIAGAVSIAFGIFTQIGALLIMGAMLGAMYKKIFVWKTGFYEDKGYGWHYDLLLFLGAFVIFATHGGSLILI